MANITPLRRQDLPQYEDLFVLFERQMGFVPNSLLTMARRPPILDGLRGLLHAVWSTGTVDPKLKPLVALMASYGAGCRYCQAHEVARSLMTGVPENKLEAIDRFEESELFSDAERAALRLALASGQHPNAVTSSHFAELRKYFDDGEIVEIVAVAAAFGFLNRWNETMATDLEARPAALAEQALQGFRWTPGRQAVMTRG